MASVTQTEKTLVVLTQNDLNAFRQNGLLAVKENLDGGIILFRTFDLPYPNNSERLGSEIIMAPYFDGNTISSLENGETVEYPRSDLEVSLVD